MAVQTSRSAPLTVDVETLRAWLEHGEPVVVLDVRPTAEYEEWSIPGSLHVDAYDDLWAGKTGVLDGVALPPGKRVVTVCGAGRTSLIAALELRARGIDAVSLANGMKAWSVAWNAARVPVEGSRAEVLQVRRTGKGCLSYLVGSNGEAAVLDASVPPVVYEGLARERGWTIRRVLDTHVHADHLTRGPALALRVGASYHLPEQQRVSFAHEPVRDGDRLSVGGSTLRALRVPGHTMESTAFLLDERALFTGDTLFVDSVGRPDLKADEAETVRRAHALHGSLRRILELPPATLVLSGHTSRPVPFDGRPIAAPLSEVRTRVTLLSQPEESFVRTILDRIPPTPGNHLLIVRLNEAGALPGGETGDIEAGANRCAIG